MRAAGLRSDHAVVGLAHGSRHPDVPAAVADLMAAVGELSGLRATSAFLDLTDPDLEAACRSLASEGITHATVVPLLFTEAFHATVDVPETIAAVTGVELRTAPILGTGDDVLAVLDGALGEVSTGRILLFAVGSSHPSANAAVEDLGRRLGERRGIEVIAAYGTREPRGIDQLDRLGPDGVVLPLFVSPGLLLDPLTAAATARGLTVVPPLGRRLAPLVLDRAVGGVR